MTIGRGGGLADSSTVCLLAQESLKLLYREVRQGEEEESAAAVGWSEQNYRHVDVVAADHVFTDNTDAVVNTETRSVPLSTGTRQLNNK